MRKTYFVTGVAMLLALSLACSRQSAAPVSPSSAKPASVSDTAGPSGETLKIGAPVPISPINDAVLDGADATLVCSASTGKFVGTTLAYDFELYDSNNVKVRTEVVAGTTWVVRGLDFEGHYTWRVRGTSDDAYGPWSTFGSFQTPANRGYIRGNELFDPLTNGETVGTLMNDVTFLPGQGVRLNSIESFVQYQLQTPLTDGQYSVTITGLRNSNEQWKTKVMSMLQGDGVNITDNAYRFTADRRNRDAGGTVRWTLRSRGVDAGEPVCGNASWDITHLYLWTYNWAGGNGRLTVQDGGPFGAVYRSCATNYRAPYAPNPHIIRLGSIGGRGGSETLPGAIFRNVWVSQNPRPVFPGDTP
jgi:hypothetical protein